MILTSESLDEDFLKSILQSSFNGIMTFKTVRNVHDEILDFEWVFSNDVACMTVGLSVEKMIGYRLLDVMPGNREAGLFDRYKKVVETGESAAFEQYYPGEEINKWFRISAVKTGDGFTVTFQDISEMKQTFMEAVTRERKYRKLFEESLDSIFITNEDLVLIEVNPAFIGLFLYQQDQLTCMSFGDMFSKMDDFDLFKRVFLDQGSVEEFEAVLLDQMGTKRDCLINCASILDEETQNMSYIGVVRDMTKRKRAERDLIIAEKLSMTGKISRTIAHEVRNPLTNLTLAMEQLKDEMSIDDDDAQLYFSIIRRNADRIGKLISDLLDSSKPKKLIFKTQSINKVIMGALELVRDRLDLLNMKLEESYNEDLPDLQVDDDQLKIAFLNLMVNAVEAMEKDQGILTIHTYQDRDYVHADIQDNGKGMSEQSLDRLFEPFFTSKDSGTGLGLVSVQNIIRGHRGEIKAKSKLGEGTTFTMTFPVG